MWTLSSSGDVNDIAIDLRAIVDPAVDPGIPGGRELIALGRTAVGPTPDPGSVAALQRVIGRPAAMTAVELAGAFQMINRIIEATGQPVLVRRRDAMLPVLETLNALDFPHSGLTLDRDTPSMRKLLGGLRRRLRR